MDNSEFHASLSSPLSHVNVVIQSLQEAEAMYIRLLESMPVAVYNTDADGVILSYNEQAERLWANKPTPGATPWNDVWMKIYRPDGSPLPTNEHPVAQTLRGKKVGSGMHFITEGADHKKHHLKCYPYAYHDANGKLTGVTVTLIEFTDILELKTTMEESEQKLRFSVAKLQELIDKRTAELEQKHEELKNSEERYHQMVDEVEDYAIVLLDRNGYILNWNRGAQKIKGYSEAEIVGQHFRLFYLPSDREQEVPENLIRQAMETGKAIHEGWRVRKDGTIFWGSLVLTALHNTQGEVIGFTKVTRDLTERKDAEDQLNQYNRELEEQNRELQQFAYAAAHDMKEPLRKVQYYISALMSTTAPKLPEKEKLWLDKTADAASRMQGLIDDILTYTRVSNKKSSSHSEINLQELIREIFQDYQESIEKDSIQITVGALPVVSGIPYQVRQLFDNLINNAIKYRDASRQLHIEIKASRIITRDEELPEKKKSFHLISVSDNGIGFEQEYAEKIFEMFERLHGRGEYPGSGIGLALCRKIAQNHGGFINALGAPGEGATFDVILPC